MDKSWKPNIENDSKIVQYYYFMLKQLIISLHKVYGNEADF
jgi:hypothetical protein